MGAWGVNLYQDDVTVDIKEEYKYKLHMGKTNEEAMQEIIEESSDFIEDIEDGPLFWFALADTQWNLGRLDEHVRNEALRYIKLGTDLERWKDDNKLYEKRKKVLEKLREKLLSPQPEEKKISKYRIYKCEWKKGDVFAYKLKSDYAEENNLKNQYLIIQKVDETVWYPAHIIPMVRIKITKNGAIPQTEQEIDKLEYIETNAQPFERRFWGSDATRPLKEQIVGMSFNTDEYGLLPEYWISLIITSKKMFQNELIYLGNYKNIVPPKNEFIPIGKMGFPTVPWKEFEERVLEMYLGHNKRNYEIYKKKG